MMKYRREQGGMHLLEDYAILEASKQERVVFENESFLVVCPWWATWPFETMIISKTHKRALVDLNGKDRELLAEAIADITRKYDNLFETHFPYSELCLSRRYVCLNCKRHGLAPSTARRLGR